MLQSNEIEEIIDRLYQWCDVLNCMLPRELPICEKGQTYPNKLFHMIFIIKSNFEYNITYLWNLKSRGLLFEKSNDSTTGYPNIRATLRTSLEAYCKYKLLWYELYVCRKKKPDEYEDYIDRVEHNFCSLRDKVQICKDILSKNGNGAINYFLPDESVIVTLSNEAVHASTSSSFYWPDKAKQLLSRLIATDITFYTEAVCYIRESFFSPDKQEYYSISNTVISFLQVRDQLAPDYRL